MGYINNREPVLKRKEKKKSDYNILFERYISQTDKGSNNN